ncbi:unnamed protein product [Polarella glacialis]|uniref:holo-[acyl-carrier-protein] synthase n=1 Tax=Polarella glacialis TaxID=89957 RepID=A0A813GZ38_POLGL|nr:unnamed protein product [Polarella glacialis]
MGDSSSSSSSSSAPLPGVASGRVRWAVNSSTWQPAHGAGGAEFRFLLALVPETEERAAVERFVFFEDQKRALLSRLLCRRACAAVLGLRSFQALEICRTKGRKPFLKSPRPLLLPDLANFNFNVSHEGDWVVLASEPLCVCGVDVAAPAAARSASHGASPVDLRDFEEQLAEEEWEQVRLAAAGEADSALSTGGYGTFQRFWSAKEAFVKARGDGLGFEPLSRASFRFQPSDGSDPLASPKARSYVASVRVDGNPAVRWRFFQHQLGEGHWVTVSRGPSSDVVDHIGEFANTFVRPTSSFSPEEWEGELACESPHFDELSVASLVPEDAISDFLLVTTCHAVDPES